MSVHVVMPSEPTIIGVTTTYHGSEHPYLRGHRLQIVAILKAGATPDDMTTLRTDADIAVHGGVTAADRVEVRPWMEEEGRYSFVTSDPRAVDLGVFAVEGQA